MHLRKQIERFIKDPTGLILTLLYIIFLMQMLTQQLVKFRDIPKSVMDEMELILD